LVYAENVILLGDNIDTMKKKPKTLTDASKEIGLEVNTYLGLIKLIKIRIKLYVRHTD
jgi:hypothetical protein